jgi:dihydrofolate reductase
MRTLTLHSQVTVDGFMAGPNGESDWGVPAWSDDLTAHVVALHEPVDTIILGRKIAADFISAWASHPQGEDERIVAKMNDSRRVVVSNTLERPMWDNAEVAAGDIDEIVMRLKNEPGGGIIAYGGSTLVTSLLAHELVDHIHLFVNPTAIGAGMPVFAAGAYRRLQLVAATSFDCGVVDLHYQPARS